VASDADLYLRFVGEWGNVPLKGECTDDQHSGEKDGWVEISNFKFGFGSEETTDTFKEKGKDEYARLTKKEKEAYDKAKKAHEATKDKKPATWGQSGNLKFEACSFTKAADRMSAALMAICHGGDYKIPKVEVRAVRYGGTGETFKIPFVRLFFEKVRLKSCKLNLTNEQLPTEDIEFEYDVVKMQSVWTDNATGDRRPEEPIKAGWNLEANDQKGDYAFPAEGE